MLQLCDTFCTYVHGELNQNTISGYCIINGLDACREHSNSKFRVSCDSGKSFLQKLSTSNPYPSSSVACYLKSRNNKGFKWMLNNQNAQKTRFTSRLVWKEKIQYQCIKYRETISIIKTQHNIPPPNTTYIHLMPCKSNGWSGILHTLSDSECKSEIRCYRRI